MGVGALNAPLNIYPFTNNDAALPLWVIEASAGGRVLIGSLGCLELFVTSESHPRRAPGRALPSQPSEARTPAAGPQRSIVVGPAEASRSQAALTSALLTAHFVCFPCTSNSSTNSNTSQPRNPPPPPPIRVRGRCEVAGRPCQSQPHNGPLRPRSGQPSRRRRARALRLPELSSQQPSHSPTHYPGHTPAPNPAAPSTRPDAMPSRATSARGSCRRPTSKSRPRCP